MKLRSGLGPEGTKTPVWKNESFQADLLALREETIRASLGMKNGQAFTPDLLTALLQAAATLACSDSDQHRFLPLPVTVKIETLSRQIENSITVIPNRELSDANE